MASSFAFIGMGVVCGLSTIFLVPAQYEVGVWLALVAVLVFAMLRTDTVGVWKPAFGASMLSGASITASHLVLLEPYLRSHTEEAAWLAGSNLGLSDWAVLLLIAPVYWVVLFVLVGSVASAWKAIRRAQTA